MNIDSTATLEIDAKALACAGGAKRIVLIDGRTQSQTIVAALTALSTTQFDDANSTGRVHLYMETYDDNGTARARLLCDVANEAATRILLR